MHERTPLLKSPDPPKPDSWASTLQTWKIPILCFVVAFLFDSAEAVRATPRTQMFESILCRRYYNVMDLPEVPFSLAIPDRMCKVGDIQGELVATQAWLKIGENLFSLIVAIPFGRLANSKGRTLVLGLGTMGQILAEVCILIVCYFSNVLPFGLVYISVLFKALGGGQMVLSGIIHAILTDVVPEESRAQAFFYLASTDLISEVVAPLLGSFLMQSGSIFKPSLCAFPLQVLAIVVISAIPDTPHFAKDCDETHSDQASTDSSPRRHAPREGLKEKIHRASTVVQDNVALVLVGASFLATMLAKDTLDYLVQYASKRFEWTLAEANYLVSLKAVSNLLLFLLILPAITNSLSHRYRLPSPKIDLWIACGSSFFGVLGPVLLGLSPTPGLMILSLILFTLSLGYAPALQSYGTSLVQPIDVAPFFSALAMTRIAGTLVVSPLIAQAFSFGLKVGGSALGMPFYIAGGLSGVGALGAWVIGCLGRPKTHSV